MNVFRMFILNILSYWIIKNIPFVPMLVQRKRGDKSCVGVDSEGTQIWMTFVKCMQL